MDDKILDPRTYLPNLYKGVREIEQLSAAQLYVLKYIYQQYDDILNNQFVLTADALGITRFEQTLGLVHNPALDLESRRQRVLSMMSTATTFNLKTLEAKLKEMCDEESYNLSIDFENFIMDLDVRIIKKGMLEVLYDLLYSMLPAHAAFTIVNNIASKHKLESMSGCALNTGSIIRVSDVGEEI